MRTLLLNNTLKPGADIKARKLNPKKVEHEIKETIALQNEILELKTVSLESLEMRITI